MVLKSDQQRMKALLKETITLLCKNGLHYKSEFCVEALIGITLDHNDVFLVNIKETIRDELKAAKELSQMADADAALEAPSPTSTETDRAAPRRRRHSGREDRRTRTVNQTDSFTGEGECTENVSPAGQESYELSEADQLSECVKQEENGEWSSSRSEQTQAENLSDTAYKRSHQEDVEYSSQHTPKKRRYSNHNDEVSHSEDDDVVFIKDEPLSDSELQQVTLGIAHAQNQAMHQYGYQGTPNQAAIPLSGLSAEPLPGCSNWSMPAGSGDINTPVSLGAPPGGGDQGASGSNVSSQASMSTVPRSTLYRRRMKEVEPEKYLQYIQKQRERNKLNRNKLKDIAKKALPSPIEKYKIETARKKARLRQKKYREMRKYTTDSW